MPGHSHRLRHHRDRARYRHVSRYCLGHCRSSFWQPRVAVWLPSVFVLSRSLSFGEARSSLPNCAELTEKH